MSDRLAVFSRGRVEQIGTPAEVYEQPTSSFVAGFVGTSNTLAPEVARVAGGPEATITVRPEKIRMMPVDQGAQPGECTVTGHVRDVIYLGAVTRYAVDLDPGGEIVVLQQNLHQSSMSALEVRGQAVRLAWDPGNNRMLHEDTATSDGEEEG